MYIDSILDKISNFFKAIVLIFMIIMNIVVFANVVSRFVFGVSIAWSTEIARYSYIWVTFLGTAIAFRKEKHANINLLYISLPRKYSNYLKMLNYILIAILFYYIFITGIKQTIIVFPFSANYLRFISLSYIYAAIPICGILVLLYDFTFLYKLIKNDILNNIDETIKKEGS